LKPSPYLVLASAVVCISTGSILVRKAEAPSLAIAFYRVGLASLLLAPFALRPLARSWPGLAPRTRLALLGSGVALALHFATWIVSLSYTTVAASVLLVNTTPVFTVLLARFWLGERPPRAVIAALPLALLGAGVIAAGDWSSSSGRSPLLGDALALLGALTLSIYHVIGRGLRASLPAGAYVLGVWATAAAVLAGLAFASRVPLGGYPPPTLAVFAALAVVPTLLGHGLVNVALRSLPAPSVGLFLLGEPVGATILAWLLLGESPALLTLVGGGIVLGALAVLVLLPLREPSSEVAGRR
jgi:drug/metabolite transporter (DMT)-like permease